MIGVVVSDILTISKGGAFMKTAGIRLLPVLLAFGLVFGGLSSGFAQQDQDAFMLEEITVTAEKREENVQKTAVSVTAISGADIRENAQVTLESVLRDVPALTIQKSPQGGQIYIRGVGANGDSNWVDPDVAITQDGVYSGRAETVFSSMYDMDRVEVLRGPQGTLYGRNATGGAVNIITKNPVDEFESIVNFQVGNYSLYHFDGAINVPVNKAFAMRLAVLREKRDGYFSNGGRESDLTGVRAKLLYEPNEDLSILLTGDYSRSKGLDNTTVAYAHTSGPPFFQWDLDPNDPYFVDSLHPADHIDYEFKTVSLNIDYDMGWSTLTILPSYTYSNRWVATDLFGGLFVPPSPTSPPSSITLEEFLATKGSTMVEDQYSVEARLASLEGSHLKWVIGAYYLDTKNQPTSIQAPGAGVSYYETYGNNRPAESLAAFAQATYPVSDTFRVTGGVRYTNDTKKIDFGVRTIGDTEAYDTGLSTMDDSYSAVTYKVGVEYDLSDSSMMYAQVSTGYKAGGYSTTAFPPVAYDPEKLTAFELGTKNRLFNERVQVNAEAYLYEYDDFQVQYPLMAHVPVPDDVIPEGGDVNTFQQWVVNADTGENYGLDLEIKALLTSKDQVDVTFAYSHARYGDLVLAGIDTPPGSTLMPGEVFDLSGSEVANSPEWSGTIGYQHSFLLPNGGMITARAQAKISDGYWATTEKHLENSYQDSFTRTNANISYTAPNEVWFANVWVKNIEDDYQITTVMPLYRRMISDPLTYGVNFTYRW